MEINNINIDEYKKTELKKYNEAKDIKNITEYQNNEELKVSLVNIDSSFRNRIPSNIIDLKKDILDNDPIYTTKNSFEIKVNIRDHNYSVGDNITIENIVNKEFILSDSLYLIENFDYCLIKLNNHNLNKIENLNEIDIKIYIESYDTFDNSYRVLGNIPINSIFTYNIVYIYNNLTIRSSILNFILNNLNINETQLNENYLFIQLPFEYSKNNKLNNNIVYTNFYNLKSILKVRFMDIGGIPIEYLNANYPIDYNKFQSKQYIHKVEKDYIYFNSKIKANYNDKSGGNKIIVGKIVKSIDGYPNANDYVIELKKSFTNVVRIELLTSEMPFIDFNIKNNINFRKNKLYWQYYEDGDYVYSIIIDEGFYNVDSLIDTLTTSMNRIERISSTQNNKIYNLFEITINKNTQEVNFIAFQFELLPNSLSIFIDENLQGAFKLTITHPNNFVQVGDTITISDATAIGDIPASLINTNHIVFEVDTFNNTYSVIIPQDITGDDLNLSGSGGSNVKLRIPSRVSFLFDRQDTIGEILGFKNTGSPNSITPFLHITSNFNDYVLPNVYDEIGNLNTSNNLLNLTNNYYYMMMYLNNYEGVITNGNLNEDNIFSKILMAGNTGDILFNTFVNSPLEFDIPISTISQFDIKFYYPDGSKPDFRNFNHSFTLRITEKISKPHNTEINTTKFNYISSLIINQ
jgi:hypothetical protein